MRSRFPESADEILWAGTPFEKIAEFARDAPLQVELGSGKARFLIEAARADPAHDFLGLELSLAYYRVCRDRIVRSELPNARIVRADARRFVELALPPASVRAFHVYFPDPWPKKRQRKRRLLDGRALEILCSRLEPGGVLRIATDYADYAAAIDSVVETVPALERVAWNAQPAPPATHYEIKYRSEGRTIWRFLLRRRT